MAALEVVTQGPATVAGNIDIAFTSLRGSLRSLHPESIADIMLEEDRRFLQDAGVVLQGPRSCRPGRLTREDVVAAIQRLSETRRQQTPIILPARSLRAIAEWGANSCDQETSEAVLRNGWAPFSDGLSAAQNMQIRIVTIVRGLTYGWRQAVRWANIAGPGAAAIDALNDFARARMREDGFFRRILPPLRISNDELDAQASPGVS